MEKYIQQAKALIAQAQDSFSRLSERDRTIALGAAVVLGTLTFVGVTFSILKGIDKAQRQVTYKSEQLREIIGMRDVFKRAQDQNAAFRARLTGNDIRLTTLVEEEAKKLSIETSNLAPHADPTEASPNGVKEQKLDVRVQKLTYDRLLKLLENIESQAKPVRIIRLKVNNRFDEKDLVDAEMTIATYKASS